MLFGHITQAAIRSLDWIAGKILTPEQVPQHQRTGRQGEEDAYFYLRKKGYVIVARNFRSPHHRGEIDLIGWDKDVLCFIEVKTRTTRCKTSRSRRRSGEDAADHFGITRLPTSSTTCLPMAVRCPQRILFRRDEAAAVRVISEYPGLCRKITFSHHRTERI